jgi:excinuclease ABC subunit C
MNEESARALISILPESPGVYRYYNDADVLIYVGKAKNIRKRVSSYFSKTAGISRKTLKLVSEIERIEYTVSNNEFDALLLENNLIKQNQPKYNILLKDDKTFPYLCILKERFPKIIYTRKYIPQQGEYFGPFSSVVAMKSVLELVQKLYAIRTCSLLLSEQNIKADKFKVCLEFHLGNCKGPCVGNQQEQDYLEDIAQARNILKGNLSIVANYFQEQMEAFAESMNFERAQFFKEKILLLEKYQSKSLVVNRSITDVDVVTLLSNDNTLYINYLLLKEGAIIFSKTVSAQKRVDEADEEILSTITQELREQSNSKSKIILSNIPLSFVEEGVENTVPQIGDKKKLISLSLKNALELKREKEISKEGRKSKNREVLEILQSDLQLKTLPIVIECFDNSNFQGTSPVASMVRFVDGKPDKKGYRHFNIKTVEGPNDFASMKEIVSRRYKRLIEEQTPLPDLIIVDGGKGQLSSAVEALKELSIYGRVPIAGIAKRLEEIYLPEDTLPLLINKKSPGLRLIQQMRDEAHRFAITFHRLKRSKVNSSSSLEEIDGLGKKTVEKLLKHFKSVKKVKAASVEELSNLVGLSLAEKIKQALQKRE